MKTEQIYDSLILITDDSITSGPATLTQSGRLTIPVYGAGSVKRMTSSFTAAPAGCYGVDCSNNAITVTPPSQPNDGDCFTLIDIARSWGTNPVTVGTSANLFLDVLNTGPFAGPYNQLSATPFTWVPPMTFVWYAPLSCWSVQQ